MNPPEQPTPNLNNEVNHQSSLKERLLKRYPSVPFLALTLAAGLGIAGFSAFQLGLFSHSFDIEGGVFGNAQRQTPTPTFLPNEVDYVMPKKESERLDILLLGIRGEEQNNQAVGALLTDTMIVLSYDRETGKTGMVSIPRDLFAKLSKNHEEKINAAYETGLARREGLEFTRKLVSQISGVYIDHVVVVDFTAFKKIIDDIGGIDIHLDKPFVEATQWGYEFRLPAGDNHLDSETALYYVRSRYSSNDFDRADRQQKVISAVKNKILSLSFLTNPSRAFDLISTLKQNIQTDLNIWDIGSVVTLARQFQGADTEINHLVLSTENALYDTKHNGAYILLPIGDNFTKIREIFQAIIK